jgi:arsenite-transporting ATPase
MSWMSDRRVLFVGGKGGVGKTTTASALALIFAHRNQRTLLVSTDPAHNLGDLFGQTIGEGEKEIASGLWALEIDPNREIDRYLRSVKQNLRELVRPEMYHDVDSHIELTRMSPGAQEAALLERVSTVLSESIEAYDRVVFDTAPTGSTLRLLSLPEVMTAWMEGLLKGRDRAESFRESLRKTWVEESMTAEGSGSRESEIPAEEDRRALRIREILDARRRRFAKARRTLQDRDRSAFLLVVIPEKLAIVEGFRAFQALSQAGVPVAGVFVNRVLPSRDLGEFLESRRKRETKYLEEIDEKFSSIPRIRIPLMEEDLGSPDGLQSIAAELERVLEAQGFSAARNIGG